MAYTKSKTNLNVAFNTTISDTSGAGITRYEFTNLCVNVKGRVFSLSPSIASEFSSSQDEFILMFVRHAFREILKIKMAILTSFTHFLLTIFVIMVGPPKMWTPRSEYCVKCVPPENIFICSLVCGSGGT